MGVTVLENFSKISENYSKIFWRFFRSHNVTHGFSSMICWCWNFLKPADHWCRLLHASWCQGSHCCPVANMGVDAICCLSRCCRVGVTCCQIRSDLMPGALHLLPGVQTSVAGYTTCDIYCSVCLTLYTYTLYSIFSPCVWFCQLRD